MSSEACSNCAHLLPRCCAGMWPCQGLCNQPCPSSTGQHLSTGMRGILPAHPSTGLEPLNQRQRVQWQVDAILKQHSFKACACEKACFTHFSSSNSANLSHNYKETNFEVCESRTVLRVVGKLTYVAAEKDCFRLFQERSCLRPI